MNEIFDLTLRRHFNEVPFPACCNPFLKNQDYLEMQKFNQVVRSATKNDAQAIVEIYNHYIVHSPATFELTPIDAAEMQARIEKVQQEYKLPWLVSENDGRIVGYAYATQWKARKAYSKTTETSIYLHKDAGGKGLGTPLYSTLLRQLQDLRYHAVIGGMSLPNEASQRLHEKLGFQKIGEFKEVGFKFDRWVDVGYWQLIF